MVCQHCGQANRSAAQFCVSCGVNFDGPTNRRDSAKNNPGDNRLVNEFQGLLRPSLDWESLETNQFVGRHQEMETLKAALTHASAGHGRLLLLVGEPGIGKSRIAREFMDYAQASGALAIWGWCYEDQGAPPYWPWVQLIRGVVHQAEPEQIPVLMSLEAADIARIVPEIGDKLPGLEDPPSLEADQSRFLFFDSILSFFKRVAQDRTLVIALDDLQWADQSSLHLLEFIAQQLEGVRLLIIGTYRSVEVTREHPMTRTLGNLVRVPGFQRIQLPQLTQSEVWQFLASFSIGSPTPELVQTVHKRTGGNPLFLVEMVRLLIQESRTGEGLLDTVIPEGIRDAVGRRLSYLSPICNELLVTASVMGTEFDFPVLQFLSGLPEDLMLGKLEEALAAGVITEIPGSAEIYQFTHPLIRETLLGYLSLSRRVRLHARIGEALEQVYQDETKDRAAELAYHFALAEPALGPEKLIRYSLLAGNQALAAHAPEEALSHFSRGLEAKLGSLSSARTEGDSWRAKRPLTISDVEAAQLVTGLGQAQAATLDRSEFEEAVINLRLAFDYYVKSGEIGSAVVIAEYPFPYWARRLPGVILLVEDALGLIPSESSEAGTLLSFYGQVLGTGKENYESAQAAFKQSLDIAQRQANVTLEMKTLTWAATTDFFHLRFNDCLEQGLKAIQLAQAARDPYVELDARYWCALALALTGDPERASALAETGLTLAERLNDRQRLAAILWDCQAIAQMRGQWDQARHFCERGLAVWPHDARFLGNRSSLEYLVGNPELGEVYLHRLINATRLAEAEPNLEHAILAAEIPLIGKMVGSLDHAELAERASERVFTAKSATSLAELVARLGRGLLAVLRNDGPAARQEYQVLENVLPNITFVELCGERLLGLLAQTMGDLDRAEGHFIKALEFCCRAHYQPELAWSALDYSKLLLRRNELSAQTKAASLLEMAKDIAIQLQMLALEEQVRCLQPQTRSLTDPSPAYPDGLTHREVEVLRLIALGKSNREIAEQLYISSHTVIRHVSNILGKTGVANRAEAASYALRHDLLK
jgi:DNA-binding CsgD family transcriptional regulator